MPFELCTAQELLVKAEPKPEMGSPGIYLVFCLVSLRGYIGQTRNLGRRWCDHRLSLRKQSHVNSHLQRAWDKYGAQMFTFVVLENCPAERLNERECHWVGLVDRANLYNLGQVGNVLPLADEIKRKRGPSHFKGRQKTEEHKRNISLASKARWDAWRLKHGKTISQRYQVIVPVCKVCGNSFKSRIRTKTICSHECRKATRRNDWKHQHAF